MMIGRTAIKGALATLAMTGSVLAQDGGGLDRPGIAERGEAFFQARMALEINYLCNAYKGVEHWAVERIAGEALTASGWYEQANDYAEFSDFVDAQSALAAQRAGELGCTPAAEPIAFSHLEQAMGLIYGDLTLAFHFASLPPGDFDYLQLNDDQIAAAQQYDAYLQQRFGPNFQLFAQHHRDRVGRKLQEVMQQDSFDPLDPYGFGSSFLYDPLLFGLGTWDLDWEMMAMRGDAQLAVDRVLLEVLVETNGLRMFERKGATANYADLVNEQTGAVKMKVWNGPITPYLNDDFDASYLLGLTDEGAIRFMVWSVEAMNQLGETPTFAILANGERMPKGTEFDYEYYRMPDWIAGAERFESHRVEDCPGRLCLDISPEDTARLLEFSSTDLVELVISPRADAGAAVATESGYRAGGIGISALRNLYADWIQGN